MPCVCDSIRFNAKSTVRRPFLIALLVLPGVLACGGDSNTAPPGPGSVTATVIMHGNGRDLDGFTFTAGSKTVSLTFGGSATISDLPAGPTVESIGGLAPQCFAAADTQRIAVPSAQTVAIQFDVTCLGGFVYAEYESSTNTQIFYRGEDGRLTQLTSVAARNYPRDISPDGTRLAFESDQTGDMNVYTIRLDGTDLKRLTSRNSVWDREPRWSPDGTRLAFTRQPSGGSATYSRVEIINADGTGEHVMTDTLYYDFDPTWSSDGLTVYFSCNRFGRYFDMCGASASGGGLTDLGFVNSAQAAGAARAAPYLAFVGGATVQEVYIAALDWSTVIEAAPGWTSFGFDWKPDATQLVVETYDGAYHLHLVNRNGTGFKELVPGSYHPGSPKWSPDGAFIGFDALPPGTTQQVWVMRPDQGEMHPITDGPVAKLHILWNPLARPGAGAVASADGRRADDRSSVRALLPMHNDAAIQLGCLHAPFQTVIRPDCTR